MSPAIVRDLTGLAADLRQAERDLAYQTSRRLMHASMHGPAQAAAWIREAQTRVDAIQRLIERRTA